MNWDLFKKTFVVLLLPVMGWSQEVKLSVIENNPVFEGEANKQLFNIRLTNYQDVRVVTAAITDGGARVFYVSCLNRSMRVELPKNKNNKLLCEERVSSMTLCDKRLVVVGNYHIFLLNFNADYSGLKLIGKIKNEDNFTFSKLVGSQVFLSVLYDFHPLDAPHKHIWGLYDVGKGELVKREIMPDDDVKFSYFVNQWFSTYGDKIAYARSTSYHIGIFDNQFNLIDSIVSDELSGNFETVKEIQSKDFHSKFQISHLKLLDDSLLTRIRKVYFTNDSTMFVLLKLKQSNQLRLDIWVKNKEENKWLKHGEAQLPLWYEEGQVYSQNNLRTLTDFYQNVFDLVYVNNQIFELWYYPYMPVVSTSDFNAKKDYYEIQNKSVIEGNSSMGVKKIRISDR